MIVTGLREYLHESGKLAAFTGRFFRLIFHHRFEWREFINQCFLIGYKSLPLTAVTAFILGLVLTMQTRPTLVEFGAQSWLPAMVSISVVREIGPVITALICAGKIGSGIGAELGSMKVTEQIDAMEVSGTNPFRYLVITRVAATTLMLPLLVIMADGVAIFGSYLAVNIKDETSFQLFMSQVYAQLTYGDIFPALIKSFFFGFAIGLIGCYKGFYSDKGTEGVGRSANSAVVTASLLVFIIDLIAVQVADLFGLT